MRVRAAFVLALGILGLVSSACDESSSGVTLVSSASTFSTVGTFSPDPLGFTSFGLFGCPAGFAIRTPFDLVVSAGRRDLTLQQVTLHLLDGSNVGGPSVTIAGIDLADGVGSAFIRAGTARRFALRPNFGCVTSRPLLLRGNVFLVDPFGLLETIALDGRFQ